MLITILFPENKDIHYIGGTEILPAPLEPEEENAAILDLESEFKEEARKKLIEHNLRLVVYIAKKFDNTGVGVEDNQSYQYFQSKQENQVGNLRIQMY